MGREHRGRRRNCSLRAISPFPTVFSKGLFPRDVKRCHCLGMGSKVSCQTISYFFFQRDVTIHTLDISGNDVGALGVIYISEMLAVNDTIHELVSSSNNSLTAIVDYLEKEEKKKKSAGKNRAA